jgi:thiamine-monophosphate kinase
MLPPAGAAVEVGAGDDAAVLTTSGKRLAITTDTQIEGVHFRREWLPCPGIGARALEITLSDLAAMGARPRSVVVALLLPAAMPGRSVLALMRGLIARAAARHCDVIGGNIAVYAGPLALTLTTIGEFPRDRKAILRGAAQPGECIYATGLPGRARLGLEALSRKAPLTPYLRDTVRKFLAPRACFDEIEFLLAHARIGAAIDISDGLAGDLGHILAESGTGAASRLRPRRTSCVPARRSHSTPRRVSWGLATTTRFSSRRTRNASRRWPPRSRDASGARSLRSAP